MAGIGFEMRKLLSRGTLVHATQAYLYAGIVSSGPWIISILAIAVLNLLMRDYLDLEQRTFFSTTVTHAYALALILTGPLQLILTRHAADDLSQGRTGRILASCIAAMSLTGLVSLVAGWILFGCMTNGSLLYKTGAVTLLINVALIFVATSYLGALHRYRSVIVAFAVGFLGSGVGALIAAQQHSVAGAVMAFSAGQALLLASLLVLIRFELESGEEVASWDFLTTLRRFPALAACGFFYNIGIWIDKILFWWLSENSLQVSGVLRASPSYDVAIYLSLLSIVPGFAVFFLVLETSFAEAFQAFFRITNGRGTLAQIEQARRGMVTSLQSGFSQLLGVQGVVTLSLLICAEPFGHFVGIGALQVGIFRVTLLGAFLLIIFLSMLTVLFYLDDRKGALAAAATFGIGNALLSLATLLANEAWYGFGFVAAAGAATFVAALRVNRRMARFVQAVFLPEPVR